MEKKNGTKAKTEDKKEVFGRALSRGGGMPGLVLNQGGICMGAVWGAMSQTAPIREAQQKKLGVNGLRKKGSRKRKIGGP